MEDFTGLLEVAVDESLTTKPGQQPWILTQYEQTRGDRGKFLELLRSRMDMYANNLTIDALDLDGDFLTGKSVEELLDLFSGNDTSGQLPKLGMSENEQLFITVLYGVAIAVALMGNFAVILVFVFGRRWDSDLSVFLANLAFSDIVLSVFCMPFTVSQVVKHYWPFSEALCPIVMFLQLSSVISSVYTLLAVGIDRYFFVTKPLKARLIQRRGAYVVGCIWIFAVALSSIQLAVVRCTNFVFNGQVYKDCQEGWTKDSHRKAYTVTVALMTYLLPLLVMVFTYHRIGRLLWRQQIPGESMQHLDVALASAVRAGDDRRVKGKQRVIKMLVVVVLIFALCWLPLHCFFLAVDFLPDLINEWRGYGDGIAFTYTFLTIHFLAMSSSFVNPLIYSFMSQNFRSDIVQIWQRSSAFLHDRLCWHRNRKDPLRDASIYSSRSNGTYNGTFGFNQRHQSSIVIRRIFAHPTPSVSASRLQRSRTLMTINGNTTLQKERVPAQ